jgi:hypothetical protein
MSSVIITIIICYTLYKIIVGHSSINPKKVNEALVQAVILTSDQVIDHIHINYLNFKNNNPEFKHIDFETYLLNFKIENQNDAKQSLEKMNKKSDSE